MHLLDDARALGCHVAGPHIHLVRRDNPNGAAIKANEYAVPVRSDALALYEQYLLERDQALSADGCDFVLVNLFHEPIGQPMTYHVVRQMLAGLSKNAGLSRAITPHMLRHGTARQLISQGADISMVQSILGQASITSTQVYVTPDEDARRAAMNALPPLVGTVRE
jgi:site-specific recombinase XerD